MRERPRKPRDGGAADPAALLPGSTSPLEPEAGRAPGARAERAVCYGHCFPVLLGDLCRGFSGTGVGHSGRGDISPFPDIRVVGVDAPRKGCLDLPEGRASYPLPFYAVSFFFLPLLQIATELRVRGSSPLMFTLLLSNLCVAALKAFGRGRAKLQLHGRLCYFCV